MPTRSSATTPSTDTFTLYNPWGMDQPGQLTWAQLQADYHPALHGQHFRHRRRSAVRRQRSRPRRCRRSTACPGRPQCSPWHALSPAGGRGHGLASVARDRGTVGWVGAASRTRNGLNLQWWGSLRSTHPTVAGGRGDGARDSPASLGLRRLHPERLDGQDLPVRQRRKLGVRLASDTSRPPRRCRPPAAGTAPRIFQPKAWIVTFRSFSKRTGSAMCQR